MADILARMRQIIGTISEWTDDNLIIGDGEIALERGDDGGVRLKIGNGVDQYLDLPYVGSGFAGAETVWTNFPAFVLNTDHTSPSYPMSISVVATFAANGGICTIVVGGVGITACGNGGNGQMIQSMSAVIPPNTVYRVNATSMDDVDVFELRIP